ncbi:transcription factor SOX-3-like [Copidosoma floridanum]|uniref:transcription factor SOX-3-like n=1 Tax=Copidosoma floridanum TaxID=29053 RepID=UPI0006C99F5B|nr:transcription factor SOX-3-like [Copidosoma floridanum]
MEKHHRYLVSLVDKVVSGNRHREDSQGQVFAVASDGKRLIRLARKPEIGGEKCQVVFTESDGGLRIRVEPALGPLVALPEIEAREGVGRKIPRPANAFMLFANEWRKKLAGENPRESNKDISVRLGGLWKTMPKEDKEKYFTLAREVDAEHKRRYPGS